MVLIPNDVCDHCRIVDKTPKQYDVTVQPVPVPDEDFDDPKDVLHWLCDDCLSMVRARIEAACSPPKKRAPK